MATLSYFGGQWRTCNGSTEAFSSEVPVLGDWLEEADLWLYRDGSFWEDLGRPTGSPSQYVCFIPLRLVKT